MPPYSSIQTTPSSSTARVEQLSVQQIQAIIQDNQMLQNELDALHYQFQMEKMDLQRRLRHLAARVQYLEGVKCSPEEDMKPYTIHSRRYLQYQRRRSMNKHNKEDNDDACTTAKDYYPVDESSDTMIHNNNKRGSRRSRRYSIHHPATFNQEIIYSNAIQYQDMDDFSLDDDEEEEEDESCFDYHSKHQQFISTRGTFLPPSQSTLGHKSWIIKKPNVARYPPYYRNKNYSPTVNNEPQPFDNEEDDLQILFHQLSIDGSLLPPPPPPPPCSPPGMIVPPPSMINLPPPHPQLRRVSSRKSTFESI